LSFIGFKEPRKTDVIKPWMEVVAKIPLEDFGYHQTAVDGFLPDILPLLENC